jgi:hypothetical protein
MISEYQSFLVVASSSICPAWTTGEVGEMQSTDCDLQQVIQWVKSSYFQTKQSTTVGQTLWNQRKQLVLEKFKDVLGGGLHPQVQLVLPAALIQDVLTGLHDSPVGWPFGH